MRQKKPSHSLRPLDLRLFAICAVPSLAYPAIPDHPLLPGILAPLAFSPAAIGIALVLFLCVSHYASNDALIKTRALWSRISGPLFPVLLVVSVLCKSAQLPGLLGDYALFGYRLYAYRWVAVDIATVCDAVLIFEATRSLCAIRTDRDEKGPDTSAKILVAALCGPATAASLLYLLCRALPTPALTALVCLTCGCASIALLKRFRIDQTLCRRTALLVLCGLFYCAAMRELSLDIYANFIHALPSEVLISLCCLATLLPLPLSALMLPRKRQDPSPKTDAQRLNEAVCDALASIPEYAGLSSRQKEVLTACLLGHSSASVAQQLDVSIGSVGVYRSRALARLGRSAEELEALVSQRYEEARTAERAKDAKAEKRRGIVGLMLLLGLAYAATWNFGYYGAFASSIALYSISRELTLLIGALLVLFSAVRSAPLNSNTDAMNPFRWIPLVSLASALYVEWCGYGQLNDWLVPILLLACTAVPVFSIGVDRRSSSSSLSKVASIILQGTWSLFAEDPHTGVLFGIAFVLSDRLTDGGHSLSSSIVLALIACTALIVRALANCSKKRDGGGSPKTALCDENKAWLRSQGLSDSESLVITLVAHGYTNRQIAEKLVFAPSTVSSYRSSAYKKLRVHNLDELIAILKNHR